MDVFVNVEQFNKLKLIEGSTLDNVDDLLLDLNLVITSDALVTIFDL